MEGVSYESASLAGHLKLGNLIYLYDDNNITIDGSTDLAFTEDVTKRFEAIGWHVLVVEDGNDLKAIEKAIKDAQKIKDKPKLIRVKTIIGFGMPKQGTIESAFGRAGRRSRHEKQNEISAGTKTSIFTFRKKRWRISAKPSKTARNSKKIGTRWSKNTKKRIPNSAKLYRTRAKANCPTVGKKLCRNLTMLKRKATRAYSGEVINAIADDIPQLIGGSADLDAFKQHVYQGFAGFSSRKIRSAQHSFRHPRTRDGFDDERHGALRQPDSVRRNFPDFFRLYAPGDSSCRAFAHSDDFRFHARFDRARRRRSDASIGRASRRAAGDSESRV